ncbi:hypothetical protein AADZ90_015810 [Aestuariibius sp. 2305UL40-4]|uniref:hypothetical protein n=1 Tax=Aestuariibius violaceus TaxID=3234132 RepID=UPI00345E7AF2
MRTLAIAALISAPFMASAGGHLNVEDMGAALSMLETNAQAAFQDFDIDVDPTTLTVAQLAQIHAILTSSDIPEGDKGDRIAAIVE